MVMSGHTVETNPKARTIMVTGANGFIGKKLVRKLLSQGHYVIAIVRNKGSVDKNNCNSSLNYFVCDLAKDVEHLSNITRKVDICFHLAWDGSTGTARNNLQKQLDNVAISSSVAQIANDLGCEKFIVTGTISECLSENIGLMAKKENISPYAIAKLTAFKVLTAYCSKVKLPLVWARLGNVYGSDNETGNLISYAITELIEGRSPTFSSGTQPYDFINIASVICILTELVYRDLNKDLYYVGSGFPRLLREYLLIIDEVFKPGPSIKLDVREEDGLIYKLEWFDVNDLCRDIGYSPNDNFLSDLQSMKSQNAS